MPNRLAVKAMRAVSEGFLMVLSFVLFLVVLILDGAMEIDGDSD